MLGCLHPLIITLDNDFFFLDALQGYFLFIFGKNNVRGWEDGDMRHLPIKMLSSLTPSPISFPTRLLLPSHTTPLVFHHPVINFTAQTMIDILVLMWFLAFILSERRMLYVLSEWN